MTTLVFPSPVLNEVRAMADSPLETCAVFYTHVAAGDRILVRHGSAAPESAYDIRTARQARLRPDYVSKVVHRAREDGSGIVFAHSHPLLDEQTSNFSCTDDEGEVALADYLNVRLPETDHVALLVGRQGVKVRRLATHELIELEEVGAYARFYGSGKDNGCSPYAEIFDRQVRAFGAAGQRILSRMRVGIVGLGGTGSVVALELAYLGVSNFLLIEPQTLETTNRNRVVGSRPDDIGIAKAEVARRHILDINPSAVVDIDTANDGVLDVVCCEKLRTVDFVFLCTDSNASRAAVCKLCYQFLIPGIDVGVSIEARDGTLTAITGRTQMMAPGLPCLLCTSSINPDAIRRELMSAEQRAADPYFSEDGEPQPAVISLNATMCSLATTMFLSAVAGIPVEARYQRYDGLKGVVKRAVGSADSSCLLCSTHGVFGLGDSRAVSFP